MAKKQAEELAVMDQPEMVEDQAEPVKIFEPALVMVEALVPMWAEADVVPPGMRYHLPQTTAEYLAGLGFVAILPEEAG